MEKMIFFFSARREGGLLFLWSDEENQETEEAKRSRRCRKGIRSTFLNWDKDEIVKKQVWQHN